MGNCVETTELNIACLGIQYIHWVQSVSMLLANSFQFTSDSVRREDLKNLKNAVDLGRVIARATVSYPLSTPAVTIMIKL